MNTNNKDIEWCGIHIFFNGNIYSAKCDLIINNIVKPFVFYCKEHSLIKKYFFIRYNELGPHVRLRLNCSHDYFTEKILMDFEELIDNAYSNELSPVIKNSGEEKKKYLYIDYMPELERYGGHSAIKIAEDYFYYSSETVINLIKSPTGMDKSSRLAKGLISMLVILYVFTREKDLTFIIMQNYNNGYLQAMAKEEKFKEIWSNAFKNGYDKQSEFLSEVIENVWLTMEEKEILPEPWGSFLINIECIKNDLKSVFDKGELYFGDFIPTEFIQVIYRILPSYIHMMNNRLGIPIMDESYLAFLMNSSLKQSIEIEQ